MIIRIVKMNFKAEKVSEFLELFNASKQFIRNFEGCSHLELLNDQQSPTTFFTYSFWESEKHLEQYRNSELFGSVWSKTKILFDSKPEAWSLTQKVKL